MSITDATYYQRGKKFLPNINNINAEIAGVPNATNELQLFIDKYERLFLINFLGIVNYELLKVALLNLPAADAKWKNLVTGVNYVKNSKTYRFDGLRGSNLDSLVAWYIFCKYMENDESYYSTTGIAKSTASNSNSFAPTRKYLDAWYSFLTAYQNDSTINQPTVFVNASGVVGVDYYGAEESNSLVTLETFLKDHSTDYVGYNLKKYDSKNGWGI